MVSNNDYYALNFMQLFRACRQDPVGKLLSTSHFLNQKYHFSKNKDTEALIGQLNNFKG